MRKFLAPTLSIVTAFTPMMASAVDMPVDVKRFIGRVLDNIVNPLVLMAFALASFYMLYSLVQYIYQGDKVMDKSKLKNSLIWGIVGVAVMSSVFGLLAFVANSLRNAGIDVQSAQQ